MYTGVPFQRKLIPVGELLAFTQLNLIGELNRCNGRTQVLKSFSPKSHQRNYCYGKHEMKNKGEIS
jgi:hypothetical protein